MDMESQETGRPAWQVWAARVALVIVIIAVILYYYNIGWGSR
ncbi:MAG: hypothetical protein PUB93_07180 [Firmicutes bacterium]|nr:hypothetical protein [Bacillota bacterium]